MIALEAPVVRVMPVVRAIPGAGSCPVTLRGHEQREDFFAWFGASGRRYVASVFAVDQGARNFGLPAFDAFVLIPVVREAGRRRASDVIAVEWGSMRQRAIAETLAGGINEWHVHLLGTGRSERDAIVADLRAGTGLGVRSRTA